VSCRLLGLGLPLLLLAGACRSAGTIPGYAVAVSGDPGAGRLSMENRHCGVCHDIPDVVDGHGVIGPSLEGFARRSFVAGMLPNTPANVIRWIQDPLALDPRTAMPTLGLADVEARDMAAYLYTLR
jgi:cytochrome c